MKVIMRATYDGVCADCGSDICVGDQIVWDNVTSEVWCEYCALPRRDDLPAS